MTTNIHKNCLQHMHPLPPTLSHTLLTHLNINTYNTQIVSIRTTINMYVRMYICTVHTPYMRRCVHRCVQKVNTFATDIFRQTMQINCECRKELCGQHQYLVPCTANTKTFSTQSNTPQTPLAITFTKLHNDIMQQGKSQIIHKAHMYTVHRTYIHLTPYVHELTRTYVEYILYCVNTLCYTCSNTCIHTVIRTYLQYVHRMLHICTYIRTVHTLYAMHVPIHAYIHTVCTPYAVHTHTHSAYTLYMSNSIHVICYTHFITTDLRRGAV